VKREVWKRDGGQCAFAGTQGRCTERGFLEFHHVVPYADGGPAVASNIELRCRAHNAYEAEQRFGLFVRETRGQAYSVATRSGPGRAPRSPRRGAGRVKDAALMWNWTAFSPRRRKFRDETPSSYVGDNESERSCDEPVSGDTK